MFCVKCSASVSDADHLCQSCGTELVRSKRALGVSVGAGLLAVPAYFLSFDAALILAAFSVLAVWGWFKPTIKHTRASAAPAKSASSRVKSKPKRKPQPYQYEFWHGPNARKNLNGNWN